LQYIGELCRYLTHAPVNTKDKEVSSIRYAFGNGLRSDVWSAFQERYSIKHIAEFYGATEGNTVLLNATGHVGALGWVPRVFDFLYPVCIIKAHSSDSGSEQEGMPIRAENTGGMCILADTDEIGLVIGAVDPKRSDRRFDGYQDAKASAAKLLHNVFKEGDCYFNTGDLMSRDRSGFFYWADRTGDTFRWKGENISTTEVEMILNELPFIEDCSSYGVSVKGCDGKAGMVAIKLRDAYGSGNDTPSITPLVGNTPAGTPHPSNNALSYLVVDSPGGSPTRTVAAETSASASATTAASLINGDLCTTHMHENLQPSARPRFIRVVQHLPMTSTYKRIKNDLLKQAYIPDACGDDQLFVWNAKMKSYIPLLTTADYEAVAGSTVG
jgi:acyl-CoA synthetase (AMP-forming)/AMP-acid ligase II